MPSFRKFLLYTFLLITVVLLNFLFRKKIQYAYADRLSYNTLYAVKEQFNITYIGRSGKDSILMRFSGRGIGTQNHFEVFAKDKRIADMQGPFLRMRPFSRLSWYMIRVNDRDSFDIQIEFPEGPVTPGYNLFRPVVREDLHASRDWAWQEIPASISGDDSIRTAKILRDSMHIRAGDSAVEKVIKISRYVLSRTAGKYGTPSDSMAHLSPLGQLRYVCSGRSLLFCGNFSSIFAWFSNQAGVTCRNIECFMQKNGLIDGGHVFNEVYLPEDGCWAYVDLTDGNVFVRRNGHLLNAIDIQRLLRYQGPDPGLTALHYQGDSLTETPFLDLSGFARTTFNPNDEFIFYYGNYASITNPRNLWEKISALSYLHPYYSIYSDGNDFPVYPFYIRLFSQLAAIAGLVGWLLWIGVYAVRRLSGKQVGG